MQLAQHGRAVAVARRCSCRRSVCRCRRGRPDTGGGAEPPQGHLSGVGVLGGALLAMLAGDAADVPARAAHGLVAAGHPVPDFTEPGVLRRHLRRYLSPARTLAAGGREIPARHQYHGAAPGRQHADGAGGHSCGWIWPDARCTSVPTLSWDTCAAVRSRRSSAFTSDSAHLTTAVVLILVTAYALWLIWTTLQARRLGRGVPHAPATIVARDLACRRGTGVRRAQSWLL